MYVLVTYIGLHCQKQGHFCVDLYEKIEADQGQIFIHTSKDIKKYSKNYSYNLKSQPLIRFLYSKTVSATIKVLELKRQTTIIPASHFNKLTSSLTRVNNFYIAYSVEAEQYPLLIKLCAKNTQPLQVFNSAKTSNNDHLKKATNKQNNYHLPEATAI